MKYDLVKVATSVDTKRAVVLLSNVESPKSELRLIDLTDFSCPILATRELDYLSKVIWSRAGRWFHISRDGSGWDSPVHLIELDANDLSEVSSTTLPIEYFDYTAAISPCEKYLAMGTFRDTTVHVCNAETFEILGTIPVENTFYSNGLDFSADSRHLGFIAFDQGGGVVTVGEHITDAQNAESFTAKPFFGKSQIRDDFQMTGFVTFDGACPVVVTCYTGRSFHAVKYGEDQSVVWEYKFDDPILGKNENSEIYANLMWNNNKKGCVIEGVLYVGGNSKIIAISTQTGAEINRIPLDGLSHIHMTMHVPSVHALLCADISGNCRQISLHELPGEASTPVADNSDPEIFPGEPVSRLSEYVVMMKKMQSGDVAGALAAQNIDMTAFVGVSARWSTKLASDSQLAMKFGQLMAS